MSTLILTVSNLAQLRHGMTAHHRFDGNGGTIGSHHVNWQLLDREERIQPVHCEIRWIENCFCVIDRCGETLLNDSLIGLRHPVPVRLREGDCLGVGAYRLLVNLALDDRAESLHRHSLEELLDPARRVLDRLVNDLPAGVSNLAMSAPHVDTTADICTAFRSDMGRDPLAALEDAAGDSRWRFVAGKRP